MSSREPQVTSAATPTSPGFDITVPNIVLYGDSSTSKFTPTSQHASPVAMIDAKQKKLYTNSDVQRHTTNFSNSSTKTSRDDAPNQPFSPNTFSMVGDGSLTSGGVANYSPENNMNTVGGAPTSNSTTTVSPHSNSALTPVLNQMNSIGNPTTSSPSSIHRVSEERGASKRNSEEGTSARKDDTEESPSLGTREHSDTNNNNNGLLGDILVAKVCTTVPSHLAAMRSSTSSAGPWAHEVPPTSSSSAAVPPNNSAPQKVSPNSYLPSGDIPPHTAQSAATVSVGSNNTNNSTASARTVPPSAVVGKGLMVGSANHGGSSQSTTSTKTSSTPFHPPAFYQQERFVSSVGGQPVNHQNLNNVSARSNSGLLSSMYEDVSNGLHGTEGAATTTITPFISTDRPLSASATAFTPPKNSSMPQVFVDPMRFANNSASVASVHNTSQSARQTSTNKFGKSSSTTKMPGHNASTSLNATGGGGEDSIEVYAPDSKIVYTVPNRLVSHFGTEPSGGKRMICRSYSNAYSQSVTCGVLTTNNTNLDGTQTSGEGSKMTGTPNNNNEPSPNASTKSLGNTTNIAGGGSDATTPSLCVTSVGGGSCPMGNHCKFVHIDALLSSLKMDEVHVHYIWRDLQSVSYERLNSFIVKEHPTLDAKRVNNTVLRIYGPNHREPAEEIHTTNLLYTKGSRFAFEVVAGIIPTAGPHPCHCAHYYFNQVCNRGASCAFIHTVSVGSGLREEKFKAPNFHRRVAILGTEDTFGPVKANKGGNSPEGNSPPAGQQTAVAGKGNEVNTNFYDANPELGSKLQGRRGPQEAQQGNRSSSRSATDEGGMYNGQGSQPPFTAYPQQVPGEVHPHTNPADYTNLHRVLADAMATLGGGALQQQNQPQQHIHHQSLPQQQSHGMFPTQHIGGNNGVPEYQPYPDGRNFYNNKPAMSLHSTPPTNNGLTQSPNTAANSDYHRHLQNLILQLQQHVAMGMGGGEGGVSGGMPPSSHISNGPTLPEHYGTNGLNWTGNNQMPSNDTTLTNAFAGGIPHPHHQHMQHHQPQHQHQRLHSNTHQHMSNGNAIQGPVNYFENPHHHHNRQQSGNNVGGGSGFQNQLRHPSQDGFDIGQFSLGAMGLDSGHGSTSGLGGSRGGPVFSGSTNNPWASTPQQQRHGNSSPNTPLTQATLMQHNGSMTHNGKQQAHIHQHYLSGGGDSSLHPDDVAPDQGRSKNILDFFTSKNASGSGKQQSQIANNNNLATAETQRRVQEPQQQQHPNRVVTNNAYTNKKGSTRR